MSSYRYPLRTANATPWSSMGGVGTINLTQSFLAAYCPWPETSSKNADALPLCRARRHSFSSGSRNTFASVPTSWSAESSAVLSTTHTVWEDLLRSAQQRAFDFVRFT